MHWDVPKCPLRENQSQVETWMRSDSCLWVENPSEHNREICFPCLMRVVFTLTHSQAIRTLAGFGGRVEGETLATTSRVAQGLPVGVAHITVVPALCGTHKSHTVHKRPAALSPFLRVNMGNFALKAETFCTDTTWSQLLCHVVRQSVNCPFNLRTSTSRLIRIYGYFEVLWKL